jgi:uncharacterized protein YbaR (Trm112 family)
MSAPGLTLLALRCPSCGAGLEAESEDVVFYCAACRNGYRASDTEPVLDSVEVTFLVAPTVAVAKYLPFWRLDAAVEILERQVGSASSGVAGAGLGAFIQRVLAGSSSRAGASQALRFLIPAYRTPLQNARALALGYGTVAEELGQKLGERLTGASLPVEDARKFAEFLFLLQQAQASGVLLTLRYTLEFSGPPVLVGVPFTRRGVESQASQGSLVDARFGLAE